MPVTPDHGIVYPTGSQQPNIPLVMQQQAESVEAAMNKVTKAPLIACTKTAAQSTSGTAGTYVDVTWDNETHKQGITHAAGSASFVVTEAGLYLLNVRVAFQGGSGTATIVAQVNGQDQNITLTDQVAATTAWPKPPISVLLKLAVNDVVKIRARHTLANIPLATSESSFQLSKSAVY